MKVNVRKWRVEMGKIAIPFGKKQKEIVAEERRLEEERLIAEGKLTSRKMTEEERKRYGMEDTNEKEK